MKPAAFQYYAPTTVDEAVALLAKVAPEDGRILAGGQSLVPTMAFRLARPGHPAENKSYRVRSRPGQRGIGLDMIHFSRKT